MSFTGSLPINMSFGAIQALSVRELGVFKIGYDMRLYIANRFKKLPPLVLDMGDELSNKDVAEFTVIPINYSYFKIIIKNTDGKARYVTIYNSNKLPLYDEILTGVIKVAGGEILYAKPNEYVVENGNYLQLGTDNTIDIIPNGVGGVKRITLNNKDAKIRSVLGSYTLKTDGKLYYNSTLVTENILSIGEIPPFKAEGLTVGRYHTSDFRFNDHETATSIAHSVFSSYNLEQSWSDAYDTFISSIEHPTCDWVGTGRSIAKPIGYYDLPCNKISGVKVFKAPYGTTEHIVATSTDGSKSFNIYKDVNSETFTIKEMGVYYPNADGFNAIYADAEHNVLEADPILFNHIVGGAYQNNFYFEEAELAPRYRSHIILRR